MAFRRRRRPSPLAGVDPTALAPSCRPPVTRALAARQQFTDVVVGLRDGPLQDRLGVLGEQLDAGVLAVWRTARQIASIDRVTEALAPERITAELKRARRDDAPGEVVEALLERFESTQRLLNRRDDLHERLDVLEARLDTAVARAAELALTAGPGATAEVDALGDDLRRHVVELDALAAATAELA